MTNTINKDVLKEKPGQVFWTSKHNRVQIYDLHQSLLFDISCIKCVNKEHCLEKETYCEIDDIIIKSGVFDIQAQIQGTENSRYYVYTDDHESLDTTKKALKEIKSQYYR